MSRTSQYGQFNYWRCQFDDYIMKPTWTCQIPISLTIIIDGAWSVVSWSTKLIRDCRHPRDFDDLFGISWSQTWATILVIQLEYGFVLKVASAEHKLFYASVPWKDLIPPEIKILFKPWHYSLSSSSLNWTQLTS